MNVFEQLLTKLEEADRTILVDIATRNPALNTYIGDPEKVKRVDDVDKWYTENWDFEHDKNKHELALGRRVEELEKELTTAKGEAMDINQLNTFLDEKIKAGSVVSAQQMKEEVNGIVGAKEKEFEAYTKSLLNGAIVGSLDSSFLTLKHFQEFGEVLDPNDIVKAANEAQATDLRAFYDTKFVAEKRAAKVAAEQATKDEAHKKEIEAAKEEGRKAALEERIGKEGQMPSIEGSPDLGHFQARMMRVPVENKTSVPDDAVLGRNQISAAAARDYERAKLAGTVQ